MRSIRRFALLLACALALPATAQPRDAQIVEAREALRKGDRAKLAQLKVAVQGHPLAQWVDYWELSNRLATAQHDELEAFYARWRGTYVEDRLRNDWLLVLGQRRDWANFVRDYPRFRMNDDREVLCYWLLTRHQAGEDVADAAREAWFAQRDLDDGCQLLAGTLVEAGRLTAADAWRKARLAIEFNRPRSARAAAVLVQPGAGAALAELVDAPARYLGKRPADPELALLALIRLAATDPDAVAAQLEGGWVERLGPERAHHAWAAAGKQAALKLMPGATAHFRRAWRALGEQEALWSAETLAWAVRAALRSADSDRWELVQRAIDAMDEDDRQDPAWVYWRARAIAALAPRGEDGEVDRRLARSFYAFIAAPSGFYQQLATEELGRRVGLPPAPPALSAAERDAPRSVPGFERALQLIEIGLRHEGVREWNFTLRGLSDRQLRAAAQLACEREVWDRCINTSERARAEFDVAQRFPTPYREQVLTKARSAGLDPAYMFGLIRQESRFMLDIRSSVGATGLMQLMPATAKWTAAKVGLNYKPEMITDRDVNLMLGSAYLKMVLDDFGGSMAMAAAAYNAGPSRPRRWREGGTFEPAAWAEAIPFNETRDYVKKVLSNAVTYAKVLSLPQPSLKARLGAPIGPRDPNAAPADREIP